MGCNPKTERSCCSLGMRYTKILIVIRRILKTEFGQPPSQVKRVKERPVPSSMAKTMPTIMSSRPKIATSTGNHARSKSDTVISQALPYDYSTLTAPKPLMSLYDHTSRAVVQHADLNTMNAPLASHQSIIQELQQISGKRATLLHKLQTLGQRETILLQALAHTHSTLMDTGPTFGNNNADKPLQLPQFSLLIPAPTPTAPTPNQTSTFKLPRISTDPAKPPLSRPISAPPESTPQGPKSRTTDRAPLADKTKLSLETFNSTPLYVAAGMSGSPTKSDTSASSASVTAGLPGTARSKTSKTGTPKIKKGFKTPRLRVRRNEPVFVSTKFDGDVGDSRSGSLGRRGTRTPRTPKVSKEVADVGAAVTPLQNNVTPGSKYGIGNGAKDYVVPHTVLRKKWQF
jgi:hypothetical protein